MTPRAKDGDDDDDDLANRCVRALVHGVADAVVEEEDATHDAQSSCASNDPLHDDESKTPTPRAPRRRRADDGTRFTTAPRPLLFSMLWGLLFSLGPWKAVTAELNDAGRDLSNFQGKHACSRDVLMATPATPAETASVIAAFARVRVVGVGHSWHAGLFCAGSDASSVDVVTTATRSVKQDEARSIHWFPYDRVGVVNADP